MDFPYLGILWNPQDSAQSALVKRLFMRAQLARWNPVLERAGITVYTQQTPLPYLSAQPFFGDSGMLLGVLFDRAHGQRLTARRSHIDPDLAGPAARAIRKLTRAYWGAYIALLSDPHTGQYWVLRDCSGMIPCYYTTWEGITLVSSEARNFRIFSSFDDGPNRLPPFDINWRYLAAFLLSSQLQIRESGIERINELLAGEAFSVVKNRVVIELAWDPASFITAVPNMQINDEGATLRETLQTCINAWASIHQWIIQSLSGGFDSSLVLSLLRRSPKCPHVVCVNRYSNGPAEDERPYARLVADATNTPLIEWPWTSARDSLDPSCLNLPAGAKPTVSGLLRTLDQNFFSALRAAHRFDAIWTGEGGDHLFLALTTALPLIDYLKTHCFGADFNDVLRDTASLTGQCIPHLLATGIASWLHESPANPKWRTVGASFVSADFFRRNVSPEYIEHPWSARLRSCVPGKRHQLLLLTEVLHRLRPLPDSLECMALSPLLSQPVIELCARIPTYHLLHGGMTRGLARNAFRGLLPTRIIDREVKGQTTHHALGIIHRSMPFASELLRHGALLKNGLIDRRRIEPMLAGTLPIDGPTLFPFLACLAAETWLSSWGHR